MRVHRMEPGEEPKLDHPLIEIAKTRLRERYSVFVTHGTETIVDGPFPSANAAEIGGQDIAQAWGLKEIWVVSNA